MKESIYKSYDELPLFLNAETVARVLGVSPSTGYELMHQKDLPAANRQPHRGTEGKVPGVGGAEHGRCRLKFTQWPKRDPIKNCFLLPNELFTLGLSTGEIAVYSYLLRCENRESHQCWPSYQTIGNAVGLSKKTVQKYVAMLEDRRLITTETTTIRTKDGRSRNGNLLYTIRPIQEAVNHFHERQMRQLELAAAQHKAEKKAAKLGIDYTPPDKGRSA